MVPGSSGRPLVPAEPAEAQQLRASRAPPAPFEIDNSQDRASGQVSTRTSVASNATSRSRRRTRIASRDSDPLIGGHRESVESLSEAALRHNFSGRLIGDISGCLDSWDVFPHLMLVDDEHVEQTCARAYRMLVARKNDARGKISSAQAFQGKEEALRRLEKEWSSINPQLFVASIVTLAQDAHDYLKALSLAMKHEEWRTDPPTHLYRSLRHMKRELAGSLLISFGDWDESLAQVKPILSLQNPDEDFDSMLHPWGSTQGKMSTPSKLLHRWKSEYEVHWTTLNHIIDPADTRDQVYIVKSLADSGSVSHVFNTVVGRAIQNHAFEEVFLHFLFTIVWEFLFIVCYFFLALHLHEQTQAPLWTNVLLMTLASGNVLTHVVAEPCMVMRLYGWAFPLHICGLRHLVHLSLDIYTAFVVMLMIDEDGLHNVIQLDGSRFMRTYPYAFAFAILFKWLSLIRMILCLPLFGLGLVVMPALHATSTRESLLYLFVVLIIVGGCWHSYWSLPIKPTWDSPGVPGANQVSTFMRVLRLVLLADFDLQELEGVDPVIKTATGGIIAEIDEGPPQPEIHLGVQAYFAFAVLFGVVVMNIYIGLLGNLYNEGKLHRHQIHQHFKANHVFWLLLWKHFCPWLPFYQRSILQSVSRASGRGWATDGCWVAYDKSSFMDAVSLEEQVRRLRQQLMDQDKEQEDRLDEAQDEREHLAAALRAGIISGPGVGDFVNFESPREGHFVQERPRAARTSRRQPSERASELWEGGAPERPPAESQLLDALQRLEAHAERQSVNMAALIQDRERERAQVEVLSARVQKQEARDKQLVEQLERLHGRVDRLALYSRAAYDHEGNVSAEMRGRSSPR